jgi:hypothetical protein
MNVGAVRQPVDIAYMERATAKQIRVVLGRPLRAYRRGPELEGYVRMGGGTRTRRRPVRRTSITMKNSVSFKSGRI